MRYMIFYSKDNSGHHSAAKALASACRNKPKTEAVEIFSVGDFVAPALRNFIENSYLFMVKKTPYLWTYLYDNDGVKRKVQGLKQLNMFVNKSKILRQIHRFKPDVICCTQAIPMEMIAILKQRKLIDTPLIAVPTDFHVHTYWINPAVDAYCVAASDSKAELISMGIPKSMVHHTGIPIMEKFSQPVDKEKLRNKLKLKKNLPIVLLMGGGRGLVPYKRIIKSLQALHGHLQVISITGSNGKPRKSLFKQEKKYKDMLRTLGYIENIYEYMELADIVISKPGGMTISEILAKGKPTVITNPLPGQEKCNTRFLVENKAALLAKNPQELLHHVHTLITDKPLYEKLSQKAKSLGRPDSANDIINEIEKFIKQKKAKKSNQQAILS